MDSPPIAESNSPRQPSPAFPRFSDLPPEIRLMVWELALEIALESTEPSTIPLHIYTHYIKPQDDDNDDLESPPLQTEIRWITECTRSCECSSSFFMKRTRPLEPPSLLLVCRESWAVARRDYGVQFGQIYDSATGRPWKRPQDLKELQLLLPEIFSGQLEMNLLLQQKVKILENGRYIELSYDKKNGNKFTKSFQKGVFACPSVDHFGVSVDLTSRRGMDRLDQFIAIAEHERAFVSRIQTFLVEVLLGNRPYIWRRWRDSNGWRSLGEDASWVRANKLIKFEQLKEVIVVTRAHAPTTVITPEWQVWKANQWREELMKLKAEWPARWRGVIPKLTFKVLEDTVLVTDEGSPVAV